MSFYDDMQQIASGVIGEFAQGTIRFVRSTPGDGPAYNPGEPAMTTYTVSGVSRGVSRKYVDGTQILQSDLQVTIPGDVGFIPAMTDQIVIDGRYYNEIVSVKSVPAAGTPVVFIVIFR